MVLRSLRRIPVVGFLIGLFFKLIVFLLLVSVLLVLVFKYVNPPITWLMVQRNIERRHDDRAFKLKKHWVAYDEISVNVKRAAVAAEDQRFMMHNGFDFKAIERAYKTNKTARRIRGGSTITQQTAKNLFLWPERTWLRKSLEGYFTVLLELLWSKKRILEVYLNIAETGDGIYGIDAAAETYFNTSAKSITRRQAALIIACLPNPRVFSPLKGGNYLRRRQAFIINNMPGVALPK